MPEQPSLLVLDKYVYNDLLPAFRSASLWKFIHLLYTPLNPVLHNGNIRITCRLNLHQSFGTHLCNTG